jgi:hypothetical protein
LINLFKGDKEIGSFNIEYNSQDESYNFAGSNKTNSRILEVIDNLKPSKQAETSSVWGDIFARTASKVMSISKDDFALLLDAAKQKQISEEQDKLKE